MLRRVAPIAALLLATTSCAGGVGREQASVRATTPPGATIRHTTQPEADLVLYVSNQSFDDADVQLTISIDGVTLADGPFPVEGQHNWLDFPLAMPPGDHEVTATSDTGAELTETFSTPGDRPRYAVLNYWYYPDDGRGRYFQWTFSKEPVAFD